MEIFSNFAVQSFLTPARTLDFPDFSRRFGPGPELPCLYKGPTSRPIPILSSPFFRRRRNRSPHALLLSPSAGAAPAAPFVVVCRRFRSPLPPLDSQEGEEDRPPLPRRRRPLEVPRRQESKLRRLRPPLQQPCAVS
ncbi:hypothetical protein DAI22_05g097701 [Oryza sativa Japonica Group]|nr:hypothetical protein DAI22_05g097701 [Oryza sativa Japonica Group]